MMILIQFKNFRNILGKINQTLIEFKDCGEYSNIIDVQVVDIRPEAAEDHAENIHHDHTGKIEKVKPEGAPDIFHGSAQGEVTQ